MKCTWLTHLITEYRNLMKTVNFCLEWGEYGLINQGEILSSGLNEPWGLAVSDDGIVYVADTWNHRIVNLIATEN